MELVTGPGQGGIVTFIGVVRGDNHGKQVTRLEYEAYEAMVMKTLGEIIAKCEAVGAGVRVAITHRVGALSVGEPAVMIAAGAPHRPEAFEACRMAIELIKRDVPIWKKEVGPNGEEWLGERP
jgi:molybdopterin synthase catalytic subunit